MSKRTWVIVGATSAIAEAFARLTAQSGYDLVLVGRDKPQLDIIAADMILRYQVHCDVLTIDLARDCKPIIKILGGPHHQEMDLFIAHGVMIDNEELNDKSISTLINVNILSTIQLIKSYWQKKQKQHHILYLSSVAACRGRAKNSLYGASKACVEIYLEGLQQAAAKNQHITIARLGYIDTRMTYGQPGIFYASPPETCAKACWHAVSTKKRNLYHPFFWRYIMAIITHLPFLIYKKMGTL